MMRRCQPLFLTACKFYVMSLQNFGMILTIGGNIERAFRSIGFTFATMVYLFISNYMGQKITDKTSNICERVYNSIWYDAVVSEQKLLLLIMKRRFYPLVLTACKLYVISLQNFGMVREKFITKTIITKNINNFRLFKILQTAMSYCMFMRQT
ncbi:uncharacterized protein LOC105432871 isoform X2 [Pogonomyrmex barbatus]|uniref:Uncharacterized protein LOC105432871 isoform X2 n=1 Tax=Pogonomyrmex barbatus TaxID=144034 RepID=A0A8N1SBQ1_9HYME|nr:uncharacterized protein LOC105432871 isoform X2 [Pogonomyrmex barbatus]